ncbi:MAG: VPLPA-CTERM sorting domain-containing protein [Paracoccaceae bacterium]
MTDQQLVLVGSSGFIFDAEIGSSNGDAGSFAVGFSASQPMAGEVSLLFFGFDRAQFVGFNMGWSSGEALTISNTSTYPGPFTISTVFGPTTLNQTLLFTWDDGTETDVDFNIEGQISAVPLPAALPMLAAGFGFLGIVGARRKKRKS